MFRDGIRLAWLKEKNKPHTQFKNWHVIWLLNWLWPFPWTTPACTPRVLLRATEGTSALPGRIFSYSTLNLSQAQLWDLKAVSCLQRTSVDFVLRKTTVQWRRLSCRRAHLVCLQATLTRGLVQPDARGPCGAPMQQAPGPPAVSLSPPPSACQRERGTLTQFL